MDTACSAACVYSVFRFVLEASRVGDGGRHSVLGGDGGRPPEVGRADGPSSGRRGPNIAVSDLCWQHDRVPWTLRTHRAGQTRLSHWLHDKDDQTAAMRLLLLLQDVG